MSATAPQRPEGADTVDTVAAGAAGTVSGTARVGRRVGGVISRLRSGDVVVVDHGDIDPATARALLARGVQAVVNTGPVMSGRVPSTGPEMLAEAGVVLVDQIGTESHGRVPDGEVLRIEDGVLLVGGVEVGRGRTVGIEQVRAENELARAGLPAQLDTFTGNAAAFLVREQDLVLNGVGLPELRTAIDGRAVVVVARGGDHERDLRAVQQFVRDQDPVLIAVDKAADDVLAAGLAPDVVVVSSDDPAGVPSMDALRASTDVVVRVEPGGRPRMLDSLTTLGADPVLCETTATAEDVALLLAADGGARLVVGVGVHAELGELLGHRRAALASTWFTRLRLGPDLVDAAALGQLYGGRTRLWHVLVVLLAGWLALAAAISTTPVGHEWFADLADQLRGLS